MMLPDEDRSYETKSYYLAQIRVALGGRAAEQIVFNEISSGASGDLQNVTHIVRQMITRLGMSPKLGPMVFGEQQDQVFLGKSLGHERNYGEGVAELIDKEMHDLVTTAYDDVIRMLEEHRDALNHMAAALMEVETINHKQVENLIKYGSLESPEERAEKEKAEALKAEQVETTETIAETVDTDKDEKHISPWGNNLSVSSTEEATATEKKPDKE